MSTAPEPAPESAPAPTASPAVGGTAPAPFFDRVRDFLLGHPGRPDEPALPHAEETAHAEETVPVSGEPAPGGPATESPQSPPL